MNKAVLTPINHYATCITMSRKCALLMKIKRTWTSHGLRSSKSSVLKGRGVNFYQGEIS